VLIHLTDAGQAKLDAVMPDYYQRLRLCMKGLNEAQRIQLEQMLDLINAGIPELTKQK
jgi:DNA-binding MarR family transcriptional regulator